MRLWARAYPHERGQQPPRAGSAALAVAAAVALLPPGSATGQLFYSLEGGPPVQVIPTVPEPGVPIFSIAPGTPNPLGGAGGLAGGGGTPGGSGPGGGSPPGPASALAMMLGTSWGAQAVAAAQSLGINPSALAGTCQIESGCRNVSNGNAVGPFQMFPAAFQEGLNTALRANPTLASQIVEGGAGRSDPFTNAVAAAGYQMQAVRALQSAGIANPTGLDTRGYYNFGPRHGVSIAQALDGETMGATMVGAPAAFFSQNGITPQTTVGEWRATVSQRMGGAANQPVGI